LPGSRGCGWLHTGSLCGSFLGFFLRFGSSFCLGFRFRDPLNFLSYFFRNVGRNRTGVRLFFRDSETGQKINDRFGLDLQFAGQFVDSNLIRVAHALGLRPRPPFHSYSDFASSLCPASP